MADDHNQRPYRGNETPARGASGGASGNDPLAELARLIGQNDPFSEFGRDGGRRAPATPASPVQNNAPAPSAPLYGSSDFARQPYGGAPLSAGADLYHVDNQMLGQRAAGHQGPEYDVPAYEVPGYGAPGYDASGFPVASTDAAYEQDPFPPAAQQRGMDDDYYDDVPPNRRRIGILAIAGVFALAVIGTAGAFGYRAIFGSSSVSGPPPVIKAESAPSKIVPAATSNTQTNKTTERVNDRGQGEKLVSREEQPVAVTTTGNVFPPQGQNASTLPGIGPQLGSGVVGSDPKRIRTIAIKPDQPGDAMQPAQAEPAPMPAPQPRVVSTTPRAVPTPTPAPTPAPAPARSNNPPQSIAEAVAEPEPAPRAPAPRAAPPARAEAPAAPQAQAPANAPLSLNPNSAPARAAAPAPQRTAAAAAPIAAASGGAGGYAVQVSAQRSEEEAQAAFRSLQGKFPGQLGNRQPVIKRVDLGEKGIFYRAMVGPFGDSAQASAMCSSLKAAGGTCLIQKN